MPEILGAVRLRCKNDAQIVISCVTLETLTSVVQAFKQWRCFYEVSSVQLSHAMSDQQPVMFRPENPVFIAHAIL